MVTAPPELPRTTPAEVIDAIAGLLLLHVPPAVAFVTVAVVPVQTVVAPPMAAGEARTVNDKVLFGAQPVA